ncbi:MAG TPA: NAD(P)/FAD-dependent oxidoreductase [Candidatus Coatesbacteria bacterium]|nr:NAD(P)/FAD-dependent oxidoreductase [Candidatus Coatesbacteria bacterium]
MKTAAAAVVGCGPAGIAAAVQLARHGVEYLLFEGRRPGGLLWNAHRVENYPGFPGGVPGPELAGLFLRQLEELGVAPIPEAVSGIEKQGGGFILKTTGGEYGVRRVLLAAGTRPRPWDGPVVPPECAGRVHTEVHPLRGLRGKRVVIVGAGDAAFDYALSLAGANEVAILGRSPRPRCIPALLHRATGERGVKYLPGSTVSRITSAESGRLLVECAGTGAELHADHLILAVGREPELRLLTADLLDDGGRPVRGLYVIGDAAGGRCRQTAIAAGDGVRAAMTVAFDLESSP